MKNWIGHLFIPELAGMDSGDGKGGSESVSQELDKMLAEAKVGPELIEGLGNGVTFIE